MAASAQDELMRKQKAGESILEGFILIADIVLVHASNVTLC